MAFVKVNFTHGSLCYRLKITQWYFLLARRIVAILVLDWYHDIYQLRQNVREHHQKIEEFIARICRSENVSIAELNSGSRRKEVSGAQARIAIRTGKEAWDCISQSCQAGWDIHLGHIKNPKKGEPISQSDQQHPLFFLYVEVNK